ncbi:hypothetical protein DV515_00001238, partial [Chloebia gouldiae]
EKQQRCQWLRSHLEFIPWIYPRHGCAAGPICFWNTPWKNLWNPLAPTCLPDGRAQIGLRRFPGSGKSKSILQKLDFPAELHLQDGNGLGHPRRQEPVGRVGLADEPLPDADLVGSVHPDIIHVPGLEAVQELGIAILDFQAGGEQRNNQIFGHICPKILEFHPQPGPDQPQGNEDLASAASQGFCRNSFPGTSSRGRFHKKDLIHLR